MTGGLPFFGKVFQEHEFLFVNFACGSDETADAYSLNCTTHTFTLQRKKPVDIPKFER